MKTYDLTINENLKVITDEDGFIEDAQCYSHGICDWVDCTAQVKKSDYWNEKVMEELQIYKAEILERQFDWKLAADR